MMIGKRLLLISLMLLAAGLIFSAVAAAAPAARVRLSA